MAFMLAQSLCHLFAAAAVCGKCYEMREFHKSCVVSLERQSGLIIDWCITAEKGTVTRDCGRGSCCISSIQHTGVDVDRVSARLEG